MNSIEFFPSLFKYLSIGLGLLMMVWALLNRPHISSKLSFLICLCVAIIIGLVPEDSSVCLYDRPRYMYLFLVGEDRTSIKDIGFLLYVRLCRLFLGENYKLFFVFSAFIYTYGYYYFCKTIGSNSERTYPVLFIGCLLSMGFMNYGVNTMRSGMALSAFLTGYSFFLKKEKYSPYIMMIISGLIHVSMLLPIAAFFLSRCNIKIQWYYLLWLLFFIVSAFNLAGPITSAVESLEMERFTDYIEAGEDSAYKTGFRLVFVLYSLIPILAGYFFIYLKKYNSPNYIMFYKQYLFSNAVWLLFIRMAYTDRFAYLGWFLIPFLLLLPALDQRIDRRYITVSYLVFLIVKLF